MTDEQIRCFLAVVEYSTFLEASEQLNMGQGTLSKKIQRLEEELNTSLFDRSRRHVSLTQAGEDFLPHARRLRKDFDAMSQAMESHRLNTEQRLSIGSIYFGKNNSFASILSGFMQQNPQVYIDNVGGTTCNLVQDLAEGKIDLAVVSSMYTHDSKSKSLLHDPRFLVLSLHRSPYAVLLPADHPLTSRKSLDYTDLEGMRLLTPYRDMKTYHSAFTAEYEKRGLIYSPQYCESIRAVQLLVGRGQGYALLSEEVLEMSGDTIAVPLKDPMYRESVILMLQKPKNRVARTFFIYAGEYMAEEQQSKPHV